MGLGSESAIRPELPGVPGSAVYLLAAAVCDAWPEHLTYMRKRFVVPPSSAEESVAAAILQIVGDRLAHAAEDYRWTCEIMLEEELFFRRNGRYRLSNFAEANARWYSQKARMDRYLNGLLLSQLFWENQFSALQSLGGMLGTELKPGSHLLEIGPGHGLLLARAAESVVCARLSGWDVSATSIERTGQALTKMGVRNPVDLRIRDLFSADAEAHGSFDAIVMSEVLEHLDQPDTALKIVGALLRPCGRVFVNVPINSPAPDHIRLWSSPEEIRALITACGYRVLSFAAFPMTGYSLERACKRRVTVSCVAVVTPA